MVCCKGTPNVYDIGTPELDTTRLFCFCFCFFTQSCELLTFFLSQTEQGLDEPMSFIRVIDKSMAEVLFLRVEMTQRQLND